VTTRVGRPEAAVLSLVWLVVEWREGVRRLVESDDLDATANRLGDPREISGEALFDGSFVRR
jgi:hypothetical protein